MAHWTQAQYEALDLWHVHTGKPYMIDGHEADGISLGFSYQEAFYTLEELQTLVLILSTPDITPLMLSPHLQTASTVNDAAQ